MRNKVKKKSLRKPFNDLQYIDSDSSEKPKTDKPLGEFIQKNRMLVDSIDTFEVTDSELKMIEKGPPESNYFTGFIFFMGIFFSFLANVLVSDFEKKPIALMVYLCIISVSFTGICFTAYHWRKVKKPFEETINSIRNRKNS